MKHKLTLDEIKHIANLAKIRFSDDELQKFSEQFNNILGYIEMIGECDTDGIEFEHNLDGYGDDVLQEDIPRDSINREELLRNATERTKLGYVVVKKESPQDSEE